MIGGFVHNYLGLRSGELDGDGLPLLAVKSLPPGILCAVPNLPQLYASLLAS